MKEYRQKKSMNRVPGEFWLKGPYVYMEVMEIPLFRNIIIKTERLYIRERTRALVERLFELPGHEQMTFLGITNHAELSVQLDKMEKRLPYWESSIRVWDLIEKESLIVIGSYGYHNCLPEHERAEISYSLHESYRGKRYMTEAIKPIIKFGFEQMALNRIEAFISPGNYPSRKLVENVGFVQEGILRQHYKYEGHIYDSVIYSFLKDEYHRQGSTSLP